MSENQTKVDHIFFCPGLGEDPQDLIAMYVNGGDCMGPEVRAGDHIILNTKRQPAAGNIVVTKSGPIRYQGAKDLKGREVVGVVVGVNRAL
jgi:hypothetical protein